MPKNMNWGRAHQSKKNNQDRQNGEGLIGLPIAAGGCWCGEELDHDWPGKDDGAPHPRDSR